MEVNRKRKLEQVDLALALKAFKKRRRILLSCVSLLAFRWSTSFDCSRHTSSLRRVPSSPLESTSYPSLRQPHLPTLGLPSPSRTELLRPRVRRSAQRSARRSPTSCSDARARMRREPAAFR
eukprot:4969268-Pleurochrysis_carterae.AAC.1